MLNNKVVVVVVVVVVIMYGMYGLLLHDVCVREIRNKLYWRDW